MGKLYIAEKRDLGEKVAASLAKLKGVSIDEHYGAQKTGYLSIGDDAVTWFRGHMYSDCKPTEYGYKFGDLKSLPVILEPDQWKKEINSSDPWYKNQIRVIQGILSDYDTYVNVGDAEREGQILVDEALIEWGIDPFGPNVMRLWSDDLTIEKLTKAIRDEFPNAEKKTLYDAALARSWADYEWGMTFTGMMTEFVRMAGGSGIFSIGRLQMAILRIVADRDKARREFKPTDHFLPSAICDYKGENVSARWKWGDDVPLDPMGRLVDKSVVDALLAKVKGQTGTVTSFTRNPKTESQPLPFDLSAVTTMLARTQGFSAAETLKIASELYLEELSSYPRGDSRHLTTSVRKEEIPLILENLKDIPEFADIAAKADIGQSSPCWNDSKVKDHYALIPTKKLTNSIWQGLSEPKKHFLRATTMQLLAQFFPPMSYDTLGAVIECQGETFKAAGRQVKNYGWKSIFKASDDDEDDDAEEKATLPAMNKGDTLVIKDINYGATTTKILPRFNDGTLVEALKSPASLVSDPELRKMIRESDGIGRPSTQASTIETLLGRKYLQRPSTAKGGRKKKTDAIELESSEIGNALIEVLPDELKAIGMTAIWEGRLENIRDGKESRDDFMRDVNAEIESLTKRLIAEYGEKGILLKGVKKLEPMEGEGNICPKCGKGHLKTIHFESKGEKRRALVCDQGRAICDYVKFEEAPVVPLERDGVLCPKCGQGHLKTIQYPDKNKKGAYKRALVCDRGKDVCGYFETVPPMEGDGELCKKCGKGHMKTIQFPDKNKKGAFKRALVCDQGRDVCDNVIFDGPKVKPMDGDGDVCPKCGQGHLKTIQFPDKNKKGAFKRALVCDRGRDACAYVKFEDTGPPVKPLPGDGKVCPKCGQGHMKTVQVPSKKKPGTMVTFLACDRGKDACGNIEFVDSEPPPSPLPGDGKVCPKCGTGHMHTKMIPSSKEKGKKFIALACDNSNCRNLEFPQKSGGR